MVVDYAEYVQRPGQDLLDFLLSAGGLAHPPQKCRLVAAVGVKPGAGVAGRDIEELPEQPWLLGGRVRPERVPLLGLPRPDEYARQVAEVPLRVALEVEVDAGRG